VKRSVRDKRAKPTINHQLGDLLLTGKRQAAINRLCPR